MTVQSKLFRKPGLLLALAVGITGGGLMSAAQASDVAAKKYLQSLTETNSRPDAVGTINVGRGPVGQASLSAVASHAHAARASFSEARAAMERGLLLGESAPKTNIAALETAMQSMFHNLSILERSGAPNYKEAITKATNLAQDWYETGLKVVKPPAEGILELPMPTTVSRKAHAAAVALNEVVEKANADATAPQRPNESKKRAAAGTRPAVTSSQGPGGRRH